MNDVVNSWDMWHIDIKAELYGQHGEGSHKHHFYGTVGEAQTSYHCEGVFTQLAAVSS